MTFTVRFQGCFYLSFSISCWYASQLLLILQHSEIYVTALIAKIFFSFPSSKLNQHEEVSIWRSFQRILGAPPLQNSSCVCFRACFQIISLFSERALLLFKQNFKCIHRWYSLIKGTLKNFANFKGKHLCWSLFTSTLLHLQLFRKFLRICHLTTLLSQKDALSEIFQNIRGGFVGT